MVSIEGGEALDQEGRLCIAHWRINKHGGDKYVKNDEGTLVPAEVQTITEHLKNTAKLADDFAKVFGAGEYAKQLGLAHDIGKYSDAFQKRIWENAPKTDHATAGAQEVLTINKENAVGMVAAYCIAGHHSGLLNGGSCHDTSDTAVSLYARRNKSLKDDYRKYAKEISLSPMNSHPDMQFLSAPGAGRNYFSLAFWTRMLFSCLVDADYLDTELFADYGISNRKSGESIEQLKVRLDRYINDKKLLNGSKGINMLRSNILHNCIEVGKHGTDSLYSLTVPTGGGKTIASMAFALNQALALKKSRIIYVIPYCSIINQTVEVFSNIFGDKNVLAHYSAAESGAEKESDIELDSKLLATENWDRPVIVTTAVQFFESLFANKTSKCRKLHNIANSVVIFDEAQTLPQPYLKPCIAAIMELAFNYHCTEVLCTATQPALNRFIDGYLVNGQISGSVIREICDDTGKLYMALRRVTYEKIGELNDDELTSRLEDCDQVLCIVATKKQAYNVYQKLHGEGNYHLSKCMTSNHIRKTIEEIRECLKSGQNCRVVATSLVEAGVDFDFPVVYRAAAGLDSIIQAGGRCNREGRYPADVSKVYVFEPERKYTSRMPDSIKRQAAIMNTVTSGAADIADLAVVSRYFNNLYNNLDCCGAGTTDGLDTKHIMSDFEANNELSIPFKDIADKFKLIDSDTVSVFVPSDDVSRKLAAKLQNAEEHITNEEYRTIGCYCVNVYLSNLRKIEKSIILINDHFAVLAVDKLYDKKTGLKLDDEGGFGIMA